MTVMAGFGRPSPVENSMPIYEFSCANCETVFSRLGKIQECREDRICPTCGGLAKRAFLTAPRLNTMSASTRKAHQTNEKSAHEPRMRNGHVCGSHCHHNKSESGAQAGNNPLKAQPGKRPWMLGH